MTFSTINDSPPKIIPYQELLGNYDVEDVEAWRSKIIPYQELLGNYDLILVC